MSDEASGDSDDLEALFDSIVAETQREDEQLPAMVARIGSEDAVADIVNRVGHLTRTLHDSLRELGYDRVIEKAARSIPDSADRLQYIADMTEQAASRTLSATEAAQPIQERLGAGAAALAGEWDRLFANQLSVEEFKALASRTRDFLRDVPAQTRATNAHLVDIMMAQDFQDLTGQVIKKMMDMTHQVESQLLELLVDHSAPERKEEIESRGLAGPVVRHDGSPDVMANQEQVDDLLASLGF